MVNLPSATVALLNLFPLSCSYSPTLPFPPYFQAAFASPESPRLSTSSIRPVWWSNENGRLSSSKSSLGVSNPSVRGRGTDNFSDDNQNSMYIEGLLLNLSLALDKWILTGSLAARRNAYSIIKQVEQEAVDVELAKQATRMASRAGMPLGEPPSPSKTVRTNDANPAKRKREAEDRKQWEAQRSSETNNGNVDQYLPKVDAGNKQDPVAIAHSKNELEKEIKNPIGGTNGSNQGTTEEATQKSSELVARAGAGTAFQGESLGIGGLDDVLSQVKRRIWVPLAAPPSLLRELGINPVRGLLLYGPPGCGKTLLARSLGKILSPARPMTVVSGPEIMDKYVGSSEANLRQLFDNPPAIYDSYRIDTNDDGDAISKAALHVIVLDEFDAMARTRGGRDGKGDQGDAGVARDSVVNQLLAKMDGVHDLKVPTLVIGLTNKRSLIEPALLRPGRFEVQIEVPPPRTVSQRVCILKVHLNDMYRAGRMSVRDPPANTVSARRLERTGGEGIPSYEELLNLLATECDGMSGASLAGVARAAASRASERAVCDFAGSSADEGVEPVEGGTVLDCLVTKKDFEAAIQDVLESSRGDDDGVDTSAVGSKKENASDKFTNGETQPNENVVT